MTTPLWGIPAIITHEQTGPLIPPRDPAALIATGEWLRGEEALRTRLVTNGRRHVEEHFNVEQNTAQLLDMVKTLIDERRIPAINSHREHARISVGQAY